MDRDSQFSYPEFDYPGSYKFDMLGITLTAVLMVIGVLGGLIYLFSRRSKS
jgi:hypothetical protein